MIGHRLRTTLAPLVAALVGVGWLAIAVPPASAAATHSVTITFGDTRIVLTVPTSWHVSRTAPTPQCGCGGDFNPVCIVASGDYDLNPNNCELVVGGNYSTQRPDQPVPEYRLPRCTSWTTTYEAHRPVGAYRGEYRIFLDRCHDRKSEQWTSLTTPSVSIWHPLSWGADDDSAAVAVGSAIVAGRGMTQGRTRELGYVRNVVVRDGHAYLAIDRAVMSLTGHMMNWYPATYLHRLVWDGVRGGCAASVLECSPTELRAQFRKGTDPADGSRPLAGRLVELDRWEHGWYVTGVYRWVFTSTGDPGHCGCG
jgi:hypothetical protein